ncbi:RHS repeat-associated core domain-containing protein [Desulfovibrio sp. JC010]|uniref:RHS repeat-associated core domain-containing protein n=1 Tax=Desulfovibrio sp. JC010 TaxID=2593641 RepID=UPI0013D5DA03|nr:RHS repeat-associated core domain-containing protein [Desulfovibrio sp. JC010]
MHAARQFELRRKNRKDLSVGLCLYGEKEAPEMQLEHMWEVVDIYTGAKLVEPKRDLSGFEDGEIMYPSMRKPEVQARWSLMEREWEEAMERYNWIKRAAHARFMFANQDMKLAQDLARTEYGQALIEEFAPRQQPEPQQPQAGTGEDLHDEFERDGVEFDPEDGVRIIPFAAPDTEEPFSVLATARNEDGRIFEKLQTLEPLNHHLHYEYDAGGRLHKVWKGKQLVEEYLYGKYGERYFGATPQTGQRRFTYGSGLRLIKAGNVKYSYDAEGRLIRKQDGCVVTSYEYNHAGQLQQVKLPDGRRISYTIDPEGKRTSKSVNGKVVETYLWHDFTTLKALTEEFGNRTDFAYNDAGSPIAMRVNDTVYFLASDQVGTVYMVADDGGNELRRIIRDSFGNMIVDTNERMNMPLGFASGLHDKDTGLVHFGHREYDPSIGRFITPDPIGFEGGDVDVYGYCHDDPVNFLDRMGLKKESEDSYTLRYDREKDKGEYRTLEYDEERDGGSKPQLMPGPPMDEEEIDEEFRRRKGSGGSEDDGEESSGEEGEDSENSGGEESGSSEGKESEEDSGGDASSERSGSKSPLREPAASGSSKEPSGNAAENKKTEGGTGSLAQRHDRQAPSPNPHENSNSGTPDKPAKSGTPSKSAQPQAPDKSDGSKKDKGTFGKIADGLKNSAGKISKGMDGLGKKSAEGTKKAIAKGSEAAGKAFKDGLEAAGKASKEVVDQYKNNEAFRNAFNTAIAAGMAPKAAAAYAAGGGPAMANAYRSLMQRGAAKASTMPIVERGLKEGYDFATAQDPTSLPAQSIGGQLGGLASGGKDFVGNVGKLYGAAKSRFGGNSNGTKR